MEKGKSYCNRKHILKCHKLLQVFRSEVSSEYTSIPEHACKGLSVFILLFH
jgi:hypothetical protein